MTDDEKTQRTFRLAADVVASMFERAAKAAAVHAFIVAVCASACIFDATVQSGAQIECTSSGDCPATMKCAGILGRCVNDDGDVTAPDAIVSLSTELLPASGAVDVTVTANEALAAPPIVQAGALEANATANEEDETIFVARFEASELGAGDHAVVALLIDENGNLGVQAGGIVRVDDIPPALDEDIPVTLDITPPPGSVVAEPTHVVVGSRVEVTFDVSEALSAPPIVTARGPADIVFDAAGEREGAFVFRFDADTPLAPGTYSVEAELVDLAGNSAVIALPLPAPGIVAEEVVPSPCVARDENGEAQCTDYDGDGVDGVSIACPGRLGADCDDTDALTHPGALEIEGDGRDNDCSGDGDTPLDEEHAIFADPAAAAGGDGTRASPFNDLFVATDAANAEGKALALRAGDFGIVPFGWFTSNNVIGGLDENFAMDVTDGQARTRIEFIDGNDTMFPLQPHVFSGVEIVSANGGIDTSVPVTLVRSRLVAVGRAIFASSATIVDSEIGGFIETINVFATNSRFFGELGAQSGLLLRTRHDAQIGAFTGGKLEVVSSSVRVVDKDRGAAVDGDLVLYGSTLRSLSSSQTADVGPAASVNAGKLFAFGSLVESRQSAFFAPDGLGGEIFVDGSALSTSCGIIGNGACLLPPDGSTCTGDPPCGSWIGAVVVSDALEEDAADPHVVTGPASVLAVVGPPLLERGAPTSAAGDLLGQCRDMSAPKLGATE